MGTVKRFNLKRLKKEFQCSSFFETGTWKGDSVAYAAQYDFDQIVSSEIIKEIAERAIDRFKDDHRVEIINQDSVGALRDNLQKIKGNCIFWLDAHFPGSEEGLKGYNDEKDEVLKYPLKKELELIAELRKQYNDVILIDDLRIYEENNYGSGNMSASIIRPSEKDSRFVEELFGNTHQIFRDLRDEGYIYLLPKTQVVASSLGSKIKSKLKKKIY